jgi:hypothetical protein
VKIELKEKTVHLDGLELGSTPPIATQERGEAIGGIL